MFFLSRPRDTGAVINRLTFSSKKKEQFVGLCESRSGASAITGPWKDWDYRCREHNGELAGVLCWDIHGFAHE